MKLLLVTQKVDKNDDVLGFFHRWILEFAKHFEFVTVICLKEGSHDFYSVKNAKPRSENSAEFSGTGVKVLSLGKEDGASRLKYIYRFYKYIWSEHKNYDVVFVHMNIEYIILGGVWLRLTRKKVFLWYNHTYGTLSARIAGIITNKTFHTSPFAFTARFKNAMKMPAGIDTNMFKRDVGLQKIPNSILYIGRISPVKYVDILLNAVKILNNRGVKTTLDIYGSAPERDKEYYDGLRKDAEEMEKNGIVSFCGSIPNYKSPKVFNKHEVSVNLTPEGNFDKTVLESMACETLTLVSSPAFESILPKEFLFEERNADDLADKIENILSMSQDQKNTYSTNMRKKIIEEHDLSTLAKKIKVTAND